MTRAYLTENTGLPICSRTTSATTIATTVRMATRRQDQQVQAAFAPSTIGTHFLTRLRGGGAFHHRNTAVVRELSIKSRAAQGYALANPFLLLRHDYRPYA